MSSLRIAFGCQARVGKDTACNYLREKYGGSVHHFSDPLYQILHHAQDVCGFPRSKDVKFLQWVGTEWGRAQKESVWVDSTLNCIPNDQNCFIGDLRFPNEIKALRDAGFLCVRITRTDRPIDRNTKHTSETALANYEDWDVVLTNDGTHEELYRKLDQLVQNRLKKD
jgi:hypothetical protein